MSPSGWFVIALVCVVSITVGVITGLYGRKHGNKKS